VAYFKTNPFDTLNEIKNEIGLIKVFPINPVIYTQLNNYVYLDILEKGEDPRSALQKGQKEIDLEQ
jgi:arabinosaccharide transport system substrate-binding protein